MINIYVWPGPSNARFEYLSLLFETSNRTSVSKISFDKNKTKRNFMKMASVAGSKRRIESKSCKIKYNALKELERGTAPKDVAAAFNIPPSTLSTWKKNKEKIFAQFNAGLLTKRSKPEKFEDVNKAVHKWLLVMRSENIPISGTILKEKALEFAEALDIESFQASQGWLAKWKTRLVGHTLSVYFHINDILQMLQ